MRCSVAEKRRVPRRHNFHHKLFMEPMHLVRSVRYWLRELPPWHAEYSRAAVVMEDELFAWESVPVVDLDDLSGAAAFIDITYHDDHRRAYRTWLVSMVGDAVLRIQPFMIPMTQPFLPDAEYSVMRCNQLYLRVPGENWLTPADPDLAATLSYAGTVDGMDVFRDGDVVMIRYPQFGYVLK
jgi:hypothetical protein